MATSYTIPMARALLAAGSSRSAVRMVRPLLDQDGALNAFSPSERVALTCIVARVALLEDRDVATARSLLTPLLGTQTWNSLPSKGRAEVEAWLGWAGLLSESPSEIRRGLMLLNIAGQRIGRGAPPDLWLWIQTGRAVALDALGHPDPAAVTAESARCVERSLCDHAARAWLSKVGGRSVPSAFPGLPSLSAAMAAVSRSVQAVASCTIPVLISGESGTGRRNLARMIHGERGWEEVTVCRCRGESEEVIAREVRDLLSASEGGAFVFHEVDHLPPNLQRELAAGLERPAMGPSPVFTSSRTITLLSDEGRLVPELLGWVGAWPITLPPLRDRAEDIPLLVYALLQEHRSSELPPVAVTDEAMARLASYPWPGNVRQLGNELERALAVVRSEPAPVIDAHRLSEDIAPTETTAAGAGGDAYANLDQILAEKEKAVIESVLARNGGQVAASADLLGLSRQGLYKKMKRLGVDPARYQQLENGDRSSPSVSELRFEHA